MKDGKQEVELPERREHQAVSRESADTTTSVLRSVVQNGTATAAQAAGRPAAAKTGTAEEDTAAWFAGYTPDLATVVAVMGQDPKTAAHKPLYGAMGLARINGGGAPAEIWSQYTRNALKGEPAADFDLQLQDGADVTAPPSSDASDEPGDGDESGSGEASDGPGDADEDGTGSETPATPTAAAPRPATTAAPSPTPVDRRRDPLHRRPQHRAGPHGRRRLGRRRLLERRHGAGRRRHRRRGRRGLEHRIPRHPRHTQASVTGGRLETHHGDQQQTDEEDPGGGRRLPSTTMPSTAAPAAPMPTHTP